MEDSFRKLRKNRRGNIILCKQKAPLENLKVIRDELKERNWVVDAFLFHYKKQEYVVLVKVY